MALAIAFDALASSERSWGCDVLRRLRHHICTTRAVRVQWVLPQVETAMRACAGDSSPLRGVQSPSTPQSPSVSRAGGLHRRKGVRSGDLLSLTQLLGAFGVGHRWHTYARVGRDEAPLFSRDWP